MNNTETRTYVYTSDEKGKAEKRKLRSVIVIAAGVLLLVVGVLLIVLAPTLSDSKDLMPNVIGVNGDKAKTELEKRGLEVVEIEVESDEYEPGVVIEQSIAPGKEIEQGMIVELTVSVAKGGTSNMFGSAPPMESVDPDDADTDGLERDNRGGYNGGYGGGSSGGSGSGSNTPTKPGTDKDNNTKGEDTKGEDTKGEDTKGEDTKGEDTKGEDTKGEDTKGEDTKGEDTKGEDTNVDNSGNNENGSSEVKPGNDPPPTIEQDPPPAVEVDEQDS